VKEEIREGERKRGGVTERRRKGRRKKTPLKYVFGYCAGFGIVIAKLQFHSFIDVCCSSYLESLHTSQPISSF